MIADIQPVMRIERAGRGGKTVTILDHLPRSETKLEKLARFLKTRCGSGGTYRIGPESGQVEIQGDKRELIRQILAREGIQCRG